MKALKIFLVTFILSPVSALAVCMNQSAQANFLCDTQSQAFDGLPCGVTRNDNARCFRIHTNQNGCTFALGNEINEDYILVWWKRKPGKTPPNSEECKNLEESIPTCIPLDNQNLTPTCPDIEVSSDECTFGCEPFNGSTSRLGSPRAELDDDWDEPCRAYALMPQGWRSDPWLPAEGFFTVGKFFPTEALGWRSGDVHYGAADALAEGRLGPTALGAVASTPLWGGKDGIVDSKAWRAHVKAVDVCVNEPGALLASLFWTSEKMTAGRKSFPVLVNCDGSPEARMGFDLREKWQAWDEEQWRASGATAAHVLPRLEGLEEHGLELVCVTPELAKERRKLRKADGPSDR